MKFVLLKLFDSLIEATDTREHLVVLLLISLYILASLHHPHLVVLDCLACVCILLPGFIKMLLHVATSCDSLNRQTLLALELVLEVVTLAHQLIVLLHCVRHLLHCFVLFSFYVFSEDSLSSKHRW